MNGGYRTCFSNISLLKFFNLFFIFSFSVAHFKNKRKLFATLSIKGNATNVQAESELRVCTALANACCYTRFSGDHLYGIHFAIISEHFCRFYHLIL